MATPAPGGGAHDEITSQYDALMKQTVHVGGKRPGEGKKVTLDDISKCTAPDKGIGGRMVRAFHQVRVLLSTHVLITETKAKAAFTNVLVPHLNTITGQMTGLDRSFSSLDPNGLATTAANAPGRVATNLNHATGVVKQLEECAERVVALATLIAPPRQAHAGSSVPGTTTAGVDTAALTAKKEALAAARQNIEAAKKYESYLKGLDVYDVIGNPDKPLAQEFANFLLKNGKQAVSAKDVPGQYKLFVSHVAAKAAKGQIGPALKEHIDKGIEEKNQKNPITRTIEGMQKYSLEQKMGFENNFNLYLGWRHNVLSTQGKTSVTTVGIPGHIQAKAAAIKKTAARGAYLWDNKDNIVTGILSAIPETAINPAAKVSFTTHVSTLNNYGLSLKSSSANQGGTSASSGPESLVPMQKWSCVGLDGTTLEFSAPKTTDGATPIVSQKDGRTLLKGRFDLGSQFAMEAETVDLDEMPLQAKRVFWRESESLLRGMGFVDAESLVGRTISLIPNPSGQEAFYDPESMQLYSAERSVIYCDAGQVANEGENGAVFVSADGCNWGDNAKKAATDGSMAAKESVQAELQQAKTTRDVARMQIDAMLKAHSAIKTDEHGETTLSQVAIVDGHLVATWVGDSKIFVIRKGPDGEDLSFEPTKASREGSDDATDSGGRIGKYIVPTGSSTVEAPDLRNLSCCVCPLEPGDIVMLCSDGVHDNLPDGKMVETLVQLTDGKGSLEEMGQAVERYVNKSAESAIVLSIDKRTPEPKYLVRKDGKHKPDHAMAIYVKYEGTSQRTPASSSAAAPAAAPSATAAAAPTPAAIAAAKAEIMGGKAGGVIAELKAAVVNSAKGIDREGNGKIIARCSEFLSANVAPKKEKDPTLLAAKREILREVINFRGAIRADVLRGQLPFRGLNSLVTEFKKIQQIPSNEITDDQRQRLQVVESQITAIFLGIEADLQINLGNSGDATVGAKKDSEVEIVAKRQLGIELKALMDVQGLIEQ